MIVGMSISSDSFEIISKASMVLEWYLWDFPVECIFMGDLPGVCLLD
jgi:hypothetical protein